MVSSTRVAFLSVVFGVVGAGCEPQLNYDPTVNRRGGYGIPEAMLNADPQSTHEVPEPLVAAQARSGAGAGGWATAEYWGTEGVGNHPEQVTLTVRPSHAEVPVSAPAPAEAPEPHAQ